MIPRFYVARARHALAVPVMVLVVLASLALGSCIDREPDPAAATALNEQYLAGWTDGRREAFADLSGSMSSAYAQGVRAGHASACTEPARATLALEAHQ